MTQTGLSRRRFIGATSGVAAAATLVSISGAPAASADTRTWKNTTSENGWSVLDEATEFTIEGSGREVALAEGDAATTLLHVARRFHYEIDSLRAGDVHGWISNREVDESYESNYLSGSAIAIRPIWYPVGTMNNLYSNELVVVRDILAELDGVVAWGGDFKVPKESHFEIALKPGHPRVKGVARKIRGWNDGPGSNGVGAIDSFDPERLMVSRAFERRAA
jgi:hypothetical protein